jgi:hypothetical protein
MLQAAKKLGVLSDLQFGARSGYMCISCVLLKRLSYDIIRQLRTTAVAFDKDAKACYDRMIPSIGVILARGVGVDKSVTTTLATTTKRMKFHVKTAFGVSPGYFNTTSTVAILGLLQGSAAVGALWALFLSLLFKVLDERFSPTVFQSPRPNRSTRRHGEAFVDDVTLWTLATGMTLLQLAPLAEAKSQVWERILWVTGGGLALPKCYYYGIQWKWTNTGEPKMCTMEDTPNVAIHLTSEPDRTRTTLIPRQEVSDGKRTLGVHLEPQGTDATNFNTRSLRASNCDVVSYMYH